MRTAPIIWILLALLLVGGALAVKPQVQAQQAGTLTVEYLEVDFFLWNVSGSKINIHAFNSTGYVLTNATTTCIIHIYNSTGRHQVEDNMGMDSNLLDFQYALPAIVYNDEGTHAYIIQCQNSKEAGYVAGQFDVLRGRTAIDPTAYIPILIGLGVLLFEMFYLGLTLKDDHYPLKLFLLWLGSMLLVPLTQMINTIAQAQFVAVSVITLTQLFNYVSIFISIVVSAYFMIYVLMRVLKTGADVAKNPLRGKSEQ